MTRASFTVEPGLVHSNRSVWWGISIVAGLVTLSVVPLLVSGEVRRLPTPDRWPVEAGLGRDVTLDA